MAANALLSAKALALRTVRILFGNAGSPDTVTTTSGALTPATWSIACAGPFPAYTPTVISVASVGQVGSTILGVDLTLNAELTEPAVYTFTATTITGVTVVTQISTAATGLLGFPASRDFSLIDFIPQINRADDTSGDMSNFVKVLQEPLNIIMHDVDHWIDILDSDLAPEDFLDLILRDLADPFDIPLTLIKKRRVAALLVNIYKQKGTTQGVQAAISLLLGMRSEFVEFNTGLGDRVVDIAHAGTGHNLGDATHTATPSFHLGGGAPWRLLVKVGTTVVSQTDAGAVSPAAGGALTPDQTTQIVKILDIMKPAHLVLVYTGSSVGDPIVVRWGCTLTSRCAIQRINSTDIKLFMNLVPDVLDQYAFLQGTHPDIGEFSASSKIAPVTSANALAGTPVTPGGVFYWSGIAQSTGQPAWLTEGLLGNEVTNALLTAAPGATVLTVTANSRSLHLAWTAVIGATRYRIYSASASMTSPVNADNAEEPIEIYADALTYDDPQEAGVTRHYMVTPVARNSEGFFSNDASGTAL